MALGSVTNVDWCGSLVCYCIWSLCDDAMSDEEVLAAYEEMVDIWGDKLPNPDHEPKRFAFYVRMYQYFKSK